MGIGRLQTTVETLCMEPHRRASRAFFFFITKSCCFNLRSSRSFRVGIHDQTDSYCCDRCLKDDRVVVLLTFITHEKYCTCGCHWVASRHECCAHPGTYDLNLPVHPSRQCTPNGPSVGNFHIFQRHTNFSLGKAPPPIFKRPRCGPDDMGIHSKLPMSIFIH